MKRIITHNDYIIEQDEQGKYYVIDEIGTSEIELIESISITGLSTYLLGTTFEFDLSGESSELVNGYHQYMYFKYV